MCGVFPAMACVCAHVFTVDEPRWRAEGANEYGATDAACVSWDGRAVEGEGDSVLWVRRVLRMFAFQVGISIRFLISFLLWAIVCSRGGRMISFAF